MKILLTGLVALSIAAASAASAQPNGRGSDHGRDDGRNGAASDHGDWGRDRGAAHRWKRGQRMGYNDWQGAHVVDYRERHLRAPPRGYEWRESNGQYILAAVATGLIASIILNSH